MSGYGIGHDPGGLMVTSKNSKLIKLNDGTYKKKEESGRR